MERLGIGDGLGGAVEWVKQLICSLLCGHLSLQNVDIHFGGDLFFPLAHNAVTARDGLLKCAGSGTGVADLFSLTKASIAGAPIGKEHLNPTALTGGADAVGAFAGTVLTGDGFEDNGGSAAVAPGTRFEFGNGEVGEEKQEKEKKCFHARTRFLLVTNCMPFIITYFYLG